MERNTINLRRDHAVITGGSKGLGYAIAKRFVDSGARVSIWDNDIAAGNAACAQLGEQARFYQVDVRRREMIDQALRQSVDAWGAVSILINNAGIAGPNANAWEYPEEDWLTILDINLNGTFYCCQAVLPVMIAAAYGRVVNVASIAGKEGNASASAYAASKGGVIAMTKSIAKELVHTGILMNCIAPAAIETDIFKQNSPEFKALLQSKIPMGRLGQPEELAALVAWLSSNECSFNTGAVFDLSGGRATY